MNKLVLTAFLLTPALAVGGLWFAMPSNPQQTLTTRNRVKADTDAAERASARAAADKAPAVAPASPTLDEAAGAVKKAMDNAKDAGAAAKDAAEDPAKDKIIRPEFLPQGYVMVVEDKSGLSSQESPLYLASSYNGWNPGDENSKLTRRSDLRWQITMKPSGTDAPIAFKFTRGSWDLEEVNEKLETIDNRGLPAVPASTYGDGKTQPIFEFVVPKWGDQRPNQAQRPDLNPYYNLTVPGVVRLEVPGGTVSPFKRDLLVWLPPGYHDAANAARTYPVLILQDGQNLFHAHPQIASHWGAAETATRLIEEGKVRPFILVGIPHAGKGRLSEYLPFPAPAIADTKPMGDWYADWVVSDVLPRVQRAFRVQTGAEHTFIGGSSMGAVVALHAATRHPKVFGGVLLESMSPLGGDNPTLKFFQGKPVPAKVYYGFGTREGTADKDPSDPNNQVYNKLFNATYEQLFKPAKGAQNLVATDAAHNEAAWAERLPKALEFLLDK